MGILYVVATPIGNLDDFSPRAIKTLKECDFILAEDTRNTIKLLNHFDIKKKMISYHKFNEINRSEEIIKAIKNGSNVALVSDAGTPCISDPGYVLVKKVRENDIDVISIPGCSAVIAPLSVSGLDTSTFTFYGFVPTENKLKKEMFEEIKSSKVKTKILYESPKRIVKLMEYIKQELPDSFVCVCSELTKLHEKSFYGKVDEVLVKMLKSEGIDKGEYVVLIQNEFKELEHNESYSIESKIIDYMVKNSCSMKSAIEEINKKEKNISKNDIYKASLRLKDILK